MTSLKDKFEQWALQDAQWWEFWMPQSGPIGGLICGALIFGPYMFDVHYALFVLGILIYCGYKGLMWLVDKFIEMIDWVTFYEK